MHQLAALGQTRQTAFYAPRTPWGDPDLQGYYTNSDESLIPMERPDTLSGKSLSDITPGELAKLNEQRNEDRIEADKQRWELRSPLHWFENHNPKNSRAWLVVDPPDGKIPPQTPEARARNAARAKARQGRGEADSSKTAAARPLHHSRAARVDDAGDLRQLIPDRAGAGLHRHRL